MQFSYFCVVFYSYYVRKFICDSQASVFSSAICDSGIVSFVSSNFSASRSQSSCSLPSYIINTCSLIGIWSKIIRVEAAGTLAQTVYPKQFLQHFGYFFSMRLFHRSRNNELYLEVDRIVLEITHYLNNSNALENLSNCARLRDSLGSI